MSTMRHNYVRYCLFALFLSLPNALFGDITFGHTFFTGRPQGMNIERWLVGQALHTHLPNTDCINGSVYFMPEYGSSFNRKEVATFLTGVNDTEDNGNIVNFGPANADGVKIFSRNLFLNDDFRSTVKFEPTVSDFVLDIHVYISLDEWIRNLYFRVDAPINWTSWNMRLTEEPISPGTTIAANKLSNTVAEAAPRTSALQGFQGSLLDTTNFPDLKQPMNFARIDGKKDVVHLADLTFVLGYDIVCNESGHFGANLQVIAPTGNSPEARFVFEPISGNGHHVGLGGGISARWELWNNSCEQSFSALFEGAAYHLFSSKQKRTFDLIANGPLSRYLLIKKFANDVYDNEILFGPNVLTRQVKVKNDVIGQGVIMFDYQYNGCTFDFGYGLWGRSKEKITITDPIPGNTYGIQGNTSTTGAQENTTQSLSTIYGLFQPGDQDGDGGDLVFLTTDDLDINSAAHPGAVSHKLFGHLAYTWEHCDYLPYIGTGGSVEFSGRSNRAFDRWAVWIKGGFTFI